jgi:hypothetical protein
MCLRLTATAYGPAWAVAPFEKYSNQAKKNNAWEKDNPRGFTPKEEGLGPLQFSWYDGTVQRLSEGSVS